MRQRFLIQSSAKRSSLNTNSTQLYFSSNFRYYTVSLHLEGSPSGYGNGFENRLPYGNQGFESPPFRTQSAVRLLMKLQT
jgi:hypothetical protein